jgi:hypothetical protein
MEAAVNPTEYLNKLRELVPARTMGMYLLGNALLMGLVQKPEDLVRDYAWVILVVTGFLLVFNMVGRLAIDRKPIGAALVSTGALALLAAAQRFTGPLAALGIDTQVAFILVTLLAAFYVALCPVLYKGNPAA